MSTTILYVAVQWRRPPNLCSIAEPLFSMHRVLRNPGSPQPDLIESYGEGRYLCTVRVLTVGKYSQ
jgi:hypothetical protein